MRSAFLSESCSSLLRPPGFCPLTQALLGSDSILLLLLLFISTSNLGSMSTRSCSLMTSYGERNTYDVLMVNIY